MSSRPHRSDCRPRPAGAVRPVTAVRVALGLLVIGLLASVASAEAPLAGSEGSTLQREPLLTPQELGDGTAADLLYADPTEGLSRMEPPEASSTGSARLEYPLVLPRGRGTTPELALTYESGGRSSWAGLGWSLSVGDISVDTQWGVPLFCPRETGPQCDNVESESYLLDGEALMPSAVRSSYLPRIANREDFTRRVETEYERIMRHGSDPDNYFWEVVDKEGNVRWYGAYPDEGGPYGAPGSRTSGRFRNDGTRNVGAILTDRAGNGFRWYLSAQRDAGVNLVRYEYETVTYQNVATVSGTAWQALSPGQACPSGRTCAKHVYLSKILYTGAGEASGHEEDPAYEVVFVRDQQRPDPVLDARGGFLDLDQERLTRIEVRYRETNQLVTRYDLAYAPGRFGKSQLGSVTQVGCAGAAACDLSTAAKHTFSYFDDVASAGGGFAGPVAWDTRSDGLHSGRHVTRASALGMSETNAGDGHIYLGFNPVSPTKTGSFGGSIIFSGGTTESLVEFVDINGDTLPDKVFRSGAELKYRLNTSRPGGDPASPVTFSDTARTISGLGKLPLETKFGISGGVGAYFGVFGVFNVGGEWSFADGYFTDANGDGLPDFVRGGSVLFNHLDCSNNAGQLGNPALCVPTFSSQDTSTRVPLTVEAVADADDSAAEALQLLRELSPRVDTVRRWVAPFGGTVTIAGTATLLDPPVEGDAAGSEPVRVAVQHNGVELGSSTLVGVGATWTPSFDRTVSKGDRIYFRTSSRAEGRGDDVEWEPTVTYPGLAAAPLDANGLQQAVYRASDDFTLAGRPGAVVTLPEEGTARYTAAFEKGATTDDVAPRLQVLPVSGGAPRQTDVTITPITADGDVDDDRVKSVAEEGGEWCVTDPSGGHFGCYPSKDEASARLLYLGAAEAGRFRLSAEFGVDPASDNKADAVQTWLAVDSPIDVGQISWLEAPRLCYPDAEGACDETKPVVGPPVDVEVYPANDLTTPSAPWTSTRGEVETVTVSLDVGADNGAGDVVLTMKQPAGYVYKQSFHIGTSGSSRTVTHDLPGLTLTSGEDYWLDLSVRSVALSDKLGNPSVTLKWTEEEEGEDVEKSVSPPVTLNWVGQQGNFPVAYRGWGLAGYRAEGTRATSAVVESDFGAGPAGGGSFDNADDACAAQPGGCMTEDDVDGMGFPDDYPVDDSGMAQVDLSSATDRIPKVFAYVPVLSATLEESWQVVDTTPRLLGTATTSRAARLGDLPPPLGAAGAGQSAPSLWGATGPAFSLMGGVGPLSGAFSFGWSSSVIDYMDMNGDGFPDIVTPEKITYTNPRGGRSCIKERAQIACDGSTGAEVVQQSTTIGVAGGLGGAPIGISANTKGRTNATQGNAGNKGGPASDKSYGANLGLSLGFSASWSNPNAADPSWDGRIDEVPGEPQGAGLATEQVLADLNGDGLPDRVTVDPNGVFVRFNLGYGFSSTPLRWSAGGFESGESYSGSLGVSPGFSGPFYDFSGGISSAAGVDFARYAWADVNGDGIPDALHKNEQTREVEVAFGTGTGIGSRASYGTMASLPFDIFPGVPTDLSGQQIRQDQAQSLGGGVDVTIGFPLCAVACYLIVNPGGHFENSVSTMDIDLRDVNGDGAPDSVRRAVADGNHEQLEVRLNTVGRTGLLRTVTTPMGGTVALDYHRVGNTLEHPGSTWVLGDVKVSSSRADDGVADQRSTFAYGTPRYAFVQREQLGFHRVVERQLAEDGTTLRSIERVYLNGSVFDSGLEASTTIYEGDVDGGTPMQRTETDWQVLNLQTNLPLSLEGVGPDDLLRLRAAPQIHGVKQIWYDAAGEVGQESSIRYRYDRLGNPVEIDDEGDPTNPDDDVVATITYSDCTTSASYELNLEFGCADGLPAPDPDDPELEPVPPAVPPTAAAPYWSKELCPNWRSTPATIEVRDAHGALLRYRDGAENLCDNPSVTRLEELVELGTSLEDSTYAVTRLGYDDWRSYNRIAYPPDVLGRSYAVFYVYDEKRRADVAEVTDLSLDEEQVEEFFDDPEDVLENDEVVGISSSATFDGPTGRVSTRTDANGNLTTYKYDALSRTKEIAYADGGSVTFEYAPTDPDYPYAVARHSDEFDADDTIDTATFVDGSGRITGQKRDAAFFVGPDEPTVTGWAVAGASQLDELGRTIKEWYPTPQLTGALTDYWEATPDTRPIETTWDALDRVVLEVGSNLAETKTTYGFAQLDGRRMTTTEVVDPLLRTTLTYRDVRDNARAIDDIALELEPLRTTYDVDALGQLHRVRPSPTEMIEHEYDLLGRRLSTTTPDGGRIEFGYDLAGNLVSKQTPVLRSQDDSRIAYGYAFGQLVSIDYPDSTPDVTFTWGGYGGADAGANGAGRVVAVVDAARQQELGYDEHGRVAREETTMLGRHPNRGPFVTSFDRDWLGRLASVTLPDGETITNDYNAGGQLSEVTGAKPCTDLGSLAFAIDDVQTTITVTENPVADVPEPPFTIVIGEEKLQVTSRIESAIPGQWTYTVVRGVNGSESEPTNVPHAAGAGVATEAVLTCLYRYLDRREYDEFGSRVHQAVGNGVATQYTRNAETRWLAEQVTTSPAAPFEVQDLRYGYDLVGNLLTADNELPDDVPSLFGGPARQRYEYDSRYRIEHAEGTWDYAPKTRRLYTYDAAYDQPSGNSASVRQRDRTIDTSCRRNCKESEQAATTYDHSEITYAAGAAHRFDVVGAQSPAAARAYTYDLDGNVTQIAAAAGLRVMTWDADGRMTEIVDHNHRGKGRKVTSYRYDYDGNLALELKEQGQTSFVNPWVTVRNATMWKHIWADTDRLATKFSQEGSYEQRVYFLHKDLQGSTSVVTDRTGKVFQRHEYFPSGEVWVDEASTIFRTPYQFAGGYVDEDHDLVDLGERWYEPRVQAFASVDPVLVQDPEAVVAVPELRASYAYAGSNPLSNVDADGRRPRPVHVDLPTALALVGTLQIDGKPLSAAQQAKLAKFFIKHQGLRGRMGLYWLSRQKRSEARQARANRLDAKPVLEFKFEDGKLSAIKLGFGVGKRVTKKFDLSTPAASTPTTSATGGAGAGGGAAGTPSPTATSPNPAPTGTGVASASSATTSAPPAAGGSTPSSPAKQTQTSAGGGGP